MSKNTTDELTTARLYDNRFNRFDDELINKYFNDEGKKSIEKYISNRVKLARIEEVNRFQHNVAWQIVHCKPHTKNGLRRAMELIDDRIATLRKELDREEPTHE